MSIILFIAGFFWLVFLVVRLSWIDTFPIASWRDYVPFHPPTAFRSFGRIEYEEKYHKNNPAYIEQQEKRAKESAKLSANLMAAYKDMLEFNEKVADARMGMYKKDRKSGNVNKTPKR